MGLWFTEQGKNWGGSYDLLFNTKKEAEYYIKEQEKLMKMMKTSK